MRSTFHGLETARRGMVTQQSALYVTGHNISNANTPGYSRQVVNFQQTEAYPAASVNRPMMPGTLGTGVEAGSIARVREQFLDIQYRGENMKNGYYSSKSEALYKMEQIMNEPSDDGLANTMNRFWNSLQDLATNPEDDGARLVVAQRGQAVADTFNYLSTTLSTIKYDLKSEIDVTTNSVNTLLTQINSLNKQISEIEPHGYLPNDLYDQRDSLVDQLSNLVNVRVTKEKPANYGNALAIAEGTYKIELMDRTNTTSYGTLVDGTNFTVNPVGVTYATETVNGNSVEYISGVTIQGGTTVTSYDFFGKLNGLVESFGYKNANGEVTGSYMRMLNDLDKLANAFAKEFNSVHESGKQYNSNLNAPSFFNDITSAKTIKMNPAIFTNPALIAAAKQDNSAGDGSNALELAAVMSKEVSTFADQASVTGITGNLNSFYEGMIGAMAVEAQESKRLKLNSEVLITTVDNNRQSVTGVSIDEEMTNMIKFQHAYNASARNITIIDEMLDKIINGLGTGGR
ncbi:flagellar hook-associated protein FlgK [Bacillus pinisoli]|uniref:flagellar hook-associated protein FlgK n=1 Tax=Bacillus pinisoli TaxID=2901866 RepID=UPI001FF4E8F7|nr:flagellar hook-associated protein FlgK [Bacillus pinisoli]